MLQEIGDFYIKYELRFTILLPILIWKNVDKISMNERVCSFKFHCQRLPESQTPCHTFVIYPGQVTASFECGHWSYPRYL